MKKIYDISKALSLKVSDGLFSIEKAEEISKLLFFNNPAALFGLDIKS